MSSEFKLIVRDLAGVKRAVITDFFTLAYRKWVNEPGIVDVLLPGDHRLKAMLANNWQVEVHRRNVAMEVDWYADFYGLYRAQKRTQTEQSYFRIRCPGQKIRLNWRWVMWAAGTSNRSQFIGQPVETIMKTLVDYNAGVNATVGNGREREGAITGVSVEADGGGGNSKDWYCAWKPLLRELQKLARIGGGDFDLVRTGGATWEFRWYAGQRGSDLSSSVIFSVQRGNMANPVYQYDRRGEATVAVVGGQNAGASRDITVRTGPDYSAANDIEVFVDARNTETEAGREAEGDERLDRLRAREEFGFDVLQTKATFYGKHYCEGGVVGDLVLARDDDVEVTQKVVGVTVALDRGGLEKIKVEMETQ
jgi:hypothetical protein